MLTTQGLSNVLWVVLFGNWLLEGRWREKWQMAKGSPLLLALAVLLLLHLAGWLWSSNYADAWGMTEKVLPLTAMLLVGITTPLPQPRQRSVILGIYILTVLVVSVIGVVRWLTIPNLPYNDIIPYISHIRFSLNCCMAIFIVGIGQWTANSGCPRLLPMSHRRLSTVLSTAVILWLLSFLLLQRSYTAVAVLVVASFTAIFTLRRRWLWLAVWLVVVGTAATFVVSGGRSYYRMQPIATAPLAATTPNGNAYEHRQDGLIENGNYVYNYLCLDEMRTQWQRRSAISCDSLVGGSYSLESVLIRYLNALGLSKDSAGVAAMTAAQVAEVERGVENPVYASHNPFKKMLYVMLFEYENYRCYRAVDGFTMLQRIELWKAALRVTATHPWIGVGTGDLHDAMDEALAEMQSPIAGRRLLPHNQYLTYLALFGIPAFIVLAVLFVRALVLRRRQAPLPTITVVWLTIILVSCLTENTLGSLIGVLFSTWFYGLTPSPSPQGEGSRN